MLHLSHNMFALFTTKQFLWWVFLRAVVWQIILNSVRVLASLNLPAALEDLSGDSIPQSIAEKSKSIVEQGGLQSIEKLIKDLPELLTRNREILDEVSGWSGSVIVAVKLLSGLLQLKQHVCHMALLFFTEQHVKLILFNLIIWFCDRWRFLPRLYQRSTWMLKSSKSSLVA